MFSNPLSPPVIVQVCVWSRHARKAMYGYVSDISVAVRRQEWSSNRRGGVSVCLFPHEGFGTCRLQQGRRNIMRPLFHTPSGTGTECTARIAQNKKNIKHIYACTAHACKATEGRRTKNADGINQPGPQVPINQTTRRGNE